MMGIKNKRLSVSPTNIEELELIDELNEWDFNSNTSIPLQLKTSKPY